MVRTWCYPDFLRRRILCPDPDCVTFHKQLQYIKATIYKDYNTAYKVQRELQASARDKGIEWFPPTRHCPSEHSGYLFKQYRYPDSPITITAIHFYYNYKATILKPQVSKLRGKIDKPFSEMELLKARNSRASSRQYVFYAFLCNWCPFVYFIMSYVWSVRTKLWSLENA